jgi:hypothetical protein
MSFDRNPPDPRRAPRVPKRSTSRTATGVAVILAAALLGLAVLMVTLRRVMPPEASEVRAALQQALGPERAALDFSVDETTVRVRGTVRSEDERDRVVEALQAVDGVVHVDDELRVESAAANR